MRRKLIKFQENEKNFNVIQPGKDIYNNIKGNWNTTYFKNSNPITLELGCGQGTYTTTLAQKYNKKNFIGVDIKGSRIWHGSSLALKNNLINVAFLRTNIEELENFFINKEVAEIFITFPDPHLKGKNIKKRLTSPGFLDIYRKIISTTGVIHLKTDSNILYDYTLKILKSKRLNVLQNLQDLYKCNNNINQEIQTVYEKKFLKLGYSIKYICFSFKEFLN